VQNAAFYYIYGRNAGGQNVRQYTTSTSFTDTGTAVGDACHSTQVQPTICSENVPTTPGSTWMMKNLFEIKHYHTATIEGNVFDYSWNAGQTGFAILFTVLNNSGGTDGNDSAVTRNITFRHNKIRHAAAAFQLTGTAADGDISDRTRDITIFNNVWEDVGSSQWGAKENIIIIGTGANAAYNGTGLRGPLNVLIDHNTFLNAQGKSVPLFDLYKNSEQSEAQNFDFTNNMFRKNDFGLRSNGSGGLQGEGTTSWNNATDAASSWASNVVVGASCSIYPGAPSPLYCPNEATFQSSFAAYSTGNYRVTSVFTTASTTGGPTGADIDAIEAFTDIALSGNNSSGGSNQTPTAEAGGPYTGLSLDPIAFSGAASTDPDGTITTYRWTWGDGTPAEDTTSATANHTYSQPGPYTVTLVVIDNGGASSAGDTAQVTVGNRAPAANAGGPYTGTPLQVITLDGGASTDPDGSIAGYQWHFGEEIVIRAADALPADIHGRWSAVADGTAAGGVRLYNSDLGEATINPALAVPANYVDLRFFASQGVPYRLWLRLRAEADHYNNDSVWVQFSGSVDAAGTPIYRMGTVAAAAVVLEEGNGAGVAGWGWNDENYGGLGSPVYFNSDGWQTVRIQQRQDGPSFDQIVLSADAYSAGAPGALKNDTTIVPLTLGTATGVSVAHGFRFAGTHYVRLTVTDNLGATNVAVGHANIAGGGSPSPDPEDLYPVTLTVTHNTTKPGSTSTTADKQ
jgi:PKD repeat protein